MENIAVYYGDNKDVNPIGNKDYNDYLKNTEKKQELPGFDQEYLDIVDYILKITHRIWEEKALGTLFDTYHNDVRVHTSAGTSCGLAATLSGTMSTLYSFPDRRLIGEDVVWSQDDENHFFSSHRILSTATNINPSGFGPATNKKAMFRTIADCAVSENRIYEEWLMRDNLAIVKQLGLDPIEVAKKMAKAMAPTKIAGIPEPMEGQFMPKQYTATDDSYGEYFKEMLQDIYNRKMINRITELFTDNAPVHTVGGDKLIGHDEIQANIVALLSSFPSARYTIDRITCNDQNDGTWHIAVRWNLRGLHLGLGTFGQPSNKPVVILGSTHYIMKGKKCIEAFEVYDALDVWRQIVDIDDQEDFCDCGCDCDC